MLENKDHSNNRSHRLTTEMLRQIHQSLQDNSVKFLLSQVVEPHILNLGNHATCGIRGIACLPHSIKHMALGRYIVIFEIKLIVIFKLTEDASFMAEITAPIISLDSESSTNELYSQLTYTQQEFLTFCEKIILNWIAKQECILSPLKQSSSRDLTLFSEN